MRLKLFLVLTGFMLASIALVVSLKSNSAADLDSCLSLKYPSSSDYSKDCLAIIMLNSLNDGSVSDISQKIQSSQSYKYLDDTRCHEALHYASRQWARGQVYKSYKLLQNVDICNSALTHGFLEGYIPDASEKGISNLAQYCQNSNNKACIDGFGHAAWSKYGDSNDLKSAANICLLFSIEEHISVCVDGLMMQMFAPADNVKAFALFDRDMLLKACKTYSSYSKALSYGCATGIGYVLYTNLLHGSVPEMPSLGADENYTALVSTLLLKTYNECGSYEGFATGCRDRVMNTFNTHFEDDTFREKVCSEIESTLRLFNDCI
ncbi:MAG: hypothetical protein ACKOW9_05130 [Candidatus Paceibacterota bacterium]